MLSHRLKVFVAIVENGGMTQAAEELFISQPAVTKHLRKLEAETGSQLIVFQRGMGMKLSKHGEILYGYCKRVQKLEQRLKNELLSNTNIIPEFKMKDSIVPLCSDPLYLNGKELNHVICGLAKTRSKRSRIYEQLKRDETIRKKIFDSGSRRFFYYHKEDVEKFIKKISNQLN